ncbi:PREDICTED: COP9 signalosome complex subunit 8 isoform X1 [Vollenhovia emeryi]|uniref:COP9 signalosome complex subunit 8 isoform X1 n=2 Tax=Vollenhovia emeryi TaxID=411798 RepID=UPI0005F40A24|nr:PREDICTED: COP9 signalosome complex subunit 8 isoform X1 [Vollenhovia emeryi]
MVPNCTLELNKLMSELEISELESPTGVVTAQAYMRLLATYLHQNDLCNAKYLWKRIPPDVKAANEELTRVWTVGQCMWQRNWPAVHAALNVEWSEDIKDDMAALKDNVRERVMRLISKAYSSLNLTTMATMSGMSLDEARRAAIDRGWHVDDTIVQPRKQVDEEQYNQSDKVCLTEEQLQKLTQFVSFLEN